MEPKDTLALVGLNEKEVQVYLALLEIGEASVQMVAKKSGVKRPTCYLVLDELIRKGFASRIVKKKLNFFIPQNPRQLLSDAEHRLLELKQSIPRLEAMLRRSDNRPHVVMYEGKDALDRAYDDSFVSKGELMFMSNITLVEDVFQRTLSKLNYAVSADLKTREILDDSEEALAYAKRTQGPYRQFRLMPKQFSPFATDIGTFGNTTLITSGKKEYFTVKIESEEIANAFRAMFEAMWQISRVPDATRS